MWLPYRFRSLFFFSVALVVVCGCKKNDSPGPNPPVTNLPAAVTPIGTPVGTAVSKSIGAAGGTIVSADGRVELFIPAGALSANTNISIQPVTNEAPNGIGLAYDFLPNGTTFSKPATLTFHYTSEDVPDNIPYYLYIAYQDSARKWKADMVQRDFDTVAKTVSLDINHFTIFSFGDGIKVTANPSKLAEAEISTVTITETVALDDEGSLTSSHPLPADILGGWFVNDKKGGSPTDGTITPNGETGVYVSPADIPNKRTVFVAVELKVRDQSFYKKGKKVNVPFPKRGTTITLNPFHEYNYHVSIMILDSTVSPFYNGIRKDIPVYTDTASFDLNLKLKKQFIVSTTSVPKNGAPGVVPNTLTYAGIEYIWLPDVTGMCNITQVKVDQLLAEDSVISISLLHNNAVIPGYIHKNTEGVVVHSGQPAPFGNPIGLPSLLKLDLKRTGSYVDIQGMFGSYQITSYALK